MQNNKQNKIPKKPNVELAKAKKDISERRSAALKKMLTIPLEQVPDYITASLSVNEFEALFKKREKEIGELNLTTDELIVRLIRAEIRYDQLFFSYNKCLELLEENGKHIAELRDYSRLRSISGGMGKKSSYRKNFEIIKNIRNDMIKKNDFEPTADEIIVELQNREIKPFAPAKKWSIETISDYLREIREMKN